MLFLLITTVVFPVLADAGYLFNTPNVAITSPSNQPAHVYHVNYQPNNAIAPENEEKDKSLSYSVSYKDYIYLKKDNVAHTHLNQLDPIYNQLQVHNSAGRPQGNREVLTAQNIPANIGYSHKDYVGHTPPVVNYNSHELPVTNTQRNHQQTATINSSVGATYGYNEGPLVVANAIYAQTNYAPNNAYSKSHVQNSGYAQIINAPNADIVNNYSQETRPSAPVANLNNGGNHGYVQSVPLGEGHHNEYSQNGVPAHVNVHVDNGHNQALSASAEVNANSAISHTLSPSSNFNSNSGYAQTVSSASATLNTGFVETSSSSISSNLNNGNIQTLSSTVSLDTGYGLPATETGDNIRYDLAPITTATGISSISHSEVSTGPTHIDLNADIAQALSSSGSALDDNFTPVLTSDHLNNGLANVLPINNLPVSVPITPAVTPIIHKHIYFHVPPPEIEEPQKFVATPPPKKNYKIIFIKVPSQESKWNIDQVQQAIAARQNAANEDKTLIYVLVKNPEDPKPVLELPKPTPSEHEVFFVKYDGNPYEFASQISDEIDKTGSINSVVPLEPGL